jgi:hypothetical protein
MGVGPCSDLYRWGGWRVGPKKGGYRTSGRVRSLLLIRCCFSHVKEQWFKDFSLEQCTEMIGGKVGVIPVEQSRRHAYGQE